MSHFSSLKQSQLQQQARLLKASTSQDEIFILGGFPNLSAPSFRVGLHTWCGFFFLPNIQTDFSFNQLVPVASHPNTMNLRVDPSSIFSTPSYHAVEETNKIPPQSLLFRSPKNSQPCQPLSICHVLQPPHHLAVSAGFVCQPSLHWEAPNQIGKAWCSSICAKYRGKKSLDLLPTLFLI